MIRDKISEAEIRSAVEKSSSIASVALLLGFKPTGGGYLAVKLLIKKFQIPCDHIKGQGWAKGRKLVLHNLSWRPLREILVRNSTHRGGAQLRERLIREQVFERKCYGCENIIWQGFPIPLELEHINGVKSDHRKENLQLLCPNCHALTPTHSGRNKTKLTLMAKDLEKSVLRERKKRWDIIKEKRMIKQIKNDEIENNIRESKRKKNEKLLKLMVSDMGQVTHPRIGLISEFSSKWGVSRTTVRRFIKNNNPSLLLATE